MEDKLTKLLQKELFEIVPFNVAVIDREFNILKANKNFRNFFGDWEGMKCFQVCKKSEKVCSFCRAANVFATGNVEVSSESGVTRDGRSCHYIVHLAPIRDDDGKVEYVAELSLDVTNPTLWQREYNVLFERVPNYITVIDRDYKIVRANEKFRKKFGEVRGRKCYEVYKKRKTKCLHCPAAQTFEDGTDHYSTQKGLSRHREETNYAVNTTPLSKNDEGVSLVMEIATDITEVTKLQEEVRETHRFYEAVVNNSADGIIALDNEGNIRIFNRAAKDILKLKSKTKPAKNRIDKLLPEEFNEKPDKKGVIAKINEKYIGNAKNEDVPVRFNAIELKSNRKKLGKAAFIEDLTEYVELEKQRLDAERLAAVGETVAGLAHTIKNMLMGLEGGIYMVDTGLRKGDASRIMQGWDVLQRNFNKTTQLVKGFLSFAKGRLPNLELIDPNKAVDNIIELYHDSAKQQGVNLYAEHGKNINKTYLDPDGLEACLTNLVSNAIDAAILGEASNPYVAVKTKEDDKYLYFEVEDNGAGMDSEVIQKIFTTFFTTKGSKGTGLGLLTTNKIVKEHGGKIDVDSELGSGSRFTIYFNKRTLEMLAAETQKNGKSKNEKKKK